MHKINKLILGLVLISSCLTVQANEKVEPKYFIGGIVDTIKEKLTPFVLDVRDLSDSPGRVSHDSKKIKINLEYKKKFAKTFKNFEEAVEQSFNEHLSIYESKSQSIVGVVNSSAHFSLTQVGLAADDSDYLRATFVADGFTFDKKQKILFRLHQRDFMDDLALSHRTVSSYVDDILSIKAIVLGLSEESYFSSNSSIASADDFTGQNLIAIVDSNETLVTQTSSIRLNYRSSKGKSIKPYVKIKQQKRRIVENFDADNLSFDKESNGSYKLTMPVSFAALKPATGRFLLKRSSSTIYIPMLVETRNDEGLEVKIKGIVKGQVDHL